MKRLHEVKRARADKRMELNEAKAAVRTKKAALRTKSDALADGEDLPAEDMTDLSALQAQVDVLEAEEAALDARVSQLELLQEQDGDEAVEVGQVETPGDNVDAGYRGGVRRGMGDNGGPRLTPHGYGEPARRAAKGNGIARIMIGKAWLKMGHTRDEVSTMIERRFNDKGVAKALNTAGTSTGGALIPQDYVMDVIELLRAEAVVRKMGPEIRDMPRGNLTISRLASSATASYGGELDAIRTSQQSFDAIQMNAKKLTAIVPVTNDLIRRTPANVEQAITNDLVKTTALAEDLAFILADGSLGTPIGLYNQCAAFNKLLIAPFTATDNATILTAVVGTSNAMKLTMKQAMSRMIRPGYIMSAVTEAFLRGMRDGVGDFVYKDEMDNGKFDGIRFEVTQQIPTNVNTGTTADPVNNGAFLMLADFADVIVADTLDYQLDLFDQATYVVGGQTVSAVQMDQTVFRVIQEHDLAMRHQGSLVVASLPGWSPSGFTNFSGGSAFYAQALSGDQSAAPSTWGSAAPTGSNNPANIAANVAGGQLPGRP